VGVITLFCAGCGDEKDEHYFGQCWMEHMTMGPSDNMDVDIIPCDCGQYIPEVDAPDYGETETDEWA